MTKEQTPKASEQGAVELREEALDQASGGVIDTHIKRSIHSPRDPASGLPTGK